MRIKSLEHSIKDTRSQISTLTDLRLRSLVGDDEFAEKRASLQRALYRLEESLASPDITNDPIEPERLLLLFSNRAISWFDHADLEGQRMVLSVVASNLFLIDKKLNLQAKKPFLSIAKMRENPNLLRDLDDVRTVLLTGKSAFAYQIFTPELLATA